MNVSSDKLTERLGIVTISKMLVLDSPEAVQKALMGSIPVRCEFLWAEDDLEMTLMHPAFDIVEKRSTPPRYMAVFDRDGDDLTVMWQREDQKE